MKNQQNGLLVLLGAVTCVFVSNPAFAQTTSVPFIGGRINITIPTAGPVIFNSGTGVTPLGTVSFTGFSSSTDYRNLTTGASATTTGSRADQVGDSVAAIGNSNGSISITSNGTSFTFTDRPTSAIGKILNITTVSTGRTIDNSISGGQINLPTEILNLSSLTSTLGTSTNVPFIGGVLNITYATGAPSLNSSTGITPFGTVTFNGGNLSFLNDSQGNQLGFSTDQIRDFISVFGNTNGIFNVDSNSSSFPFTNRRITALGILSATDPINKTLTGQITGGSINLPTSSLNLVPTTNIAILGGSFNITEPQPTSTPQKDFKFENGTFLTSLGAFTTKRNTYATFARSGGFIIATGTYGNGLVSNSTPSDASSTGFITGNISLPNGTFANINDGEDIQYDVSGTVVSVFSGSSKSSRFNLSGGTLKFPTSLISTSAIPNSTDVPFLSGNFNIDVANSGVVRFNSGSAVTPLGTVTFSASNFNNFLNRRTGLVNTASGNNVNDLIVFTGQNVTGIFGSLANLFANAPATILGKIAGKANIAGGINLTNTITSGVINLPNSVLGIEANTGFPIVGGNFFVRSNTKDFAEITVGFNTLVTSVGTVRVKVDSTSLSTLFAPSLNYQIRPGTFTPYVEPANIDAVVNKPLDITGLTSGSLGYRYSVSGISTLTNIDFSNALYNVLGRIATVNDVNPEINVNITGGNIFFPTASIRNAEQTAIQAVQQGLQERANNNPNIETGSSVLTITTPSKSAVASSSVHPGVTNIPSIQIKSEQIRANAGSLLGQNRIGDAFLAVESGQNSLLSSFTGVNLNSRVLSIGESLKELTRLSQLSNSQTALIYPVILKDRLEILALFPSPSVSGNNKVIPGRTFRASVPVPEEALIEIIARFRDNLQDPLSSDYLVESKLLYNLLIRPIEAELQASEIKTLVFAMDGDFRSIPVAALNDGNKFLIQKYATATVPSLGMANTNLSTVTSKRATTILALGLTDAIQGFSALPNVKTEIVTIGSKILSGETFLNQDFTVENLQAQRRKQDFSIIHLATHAEFDVDDAQDSFVLFWDKKVRSGQIPKLRLDKLELLTLSACQTAVGNNLGLSGLAVASGVKSVLASLWSVSDAGTAPLMMKFYSLYPDAPSKAIALQNAQIALIEGTVKIEDKTIKGIPQIGDIPLTGEDLNVNLKHPYFWSSFILIGNWL